jgi:hypothetical protein
LKWNCIFEKYWLKSYAHLKHISKIKAHVGNESTFRKWKHILQMKAYFKNESTFWKWKHILKMKAHSENESIFWEWKHISKMKALFENESTFWKMVCLVTIKRCSLSSSGSLSQCWDWIYHQGKTLLTNSKALFMSSMASLHGSRGICVDVLGFS